MNARAARSIGVIVGTDHHPFGRIIDWADEWAAANPQDGVTVQYGHSRPGVVAAGDAFFRPDDLAEMMSNCDIVISHGGPASISEARRAGHVPLVLPRDPRLNEHVDDHQLRFGRWSDEHKLVILVRSVQDLDFRVSAMVEANAGTRCEGTLQASHAEETSRRLSNLLELERSKHQHQLKLFRLFGAGASAAILTKP